MASLIFKWRCYNTFIRCCVTCTFTTLPAISYVIMHFMLHWGMFCTWHLWLFWCVTHLAAIVYYIIVCPTHSRRYRTNVLFTMSRIIFCHYFACSWFALDILWFPFFTWSLVGACIAQLSYAIVECFVIPTLSLSIYVSTLHWMKNTFIFTYSTTFPYVC